MKTVKTFSLLAVFAAFAMALLGPTAAMAGSTALCKTDTAEKKCSNLVTHIHYEADDLEVLTTALDYKCDALYLANVYSLGAPQELEGEFTYSSCDGGCSREEVGGPVVLNLLKTGHETAQLSGVPGAGVISECGGLINCVYSFENLVGEVKGPLLAAGKNGEIIYSDAILTHVSGFACPELAKLDATFILSLSEVYIGF